MLAGAEVFDDHASLEATSAAHPLPRDKGAVNGIDMGKKDQGRRSTSSPRTMRKQRVVHVTEFDQVKNALRRSKHCGPSHMLPCCGMNECLCLVQFRFMGKAPESH